MQKSRFNKYVLYFIMIFPLVLPEGISILSGTAYRLIYKYGRLLSFAIILLLYCSKLASRKRTVPVQLRYMIILAVYCLIISILGGHGSSSWQSTFWPCLLAGIIVEYGRKDTDILIETLLIILEFWIYVNLVFMLLYPNGMYVSTTIGYTKNWLLGYKSSFQYIVFPAVLLGWIKVAYGGNRLRFWALLLTSVVEALFSENAMLVVALAVVLICYLLKLTEFTKFFNPKVYSIGILVVNVLFLFSLTVLVNTSYGSAFLAYYGKSITLNGRASYIWPITMQKISQNPVFGYGVWSSDERRELYLDRPAAIHAHNQLLEMLFIGGIIFLLIYTVFFLRMNKVTRGCSSKQSTKIIMFGLFVFFCMMTVEIYMRHIGFPIWVLIYLAFVSNEIDLKYDNKLGKTKKRSRHHRIRLKTHVNQGL